MAAPEETEVETSFVLAVKGQEELQRAARQVKDFQRQAEQAKKTTFKIPAGAVPTFGGGFAAPAPTSPVAAAQRKHADLTYEAVQAQGEVTAEMRQSIRRERMIERSRQWAAREAAEKHTIGGRMALMSAQMMGASMQGAAGKIVQFGSGIASLGIELSQFGGAIGRAGALLPKLAGLASAGAAGYALGTALFNALDSADGLATGMHQGRLVLMRQSDANKQYVKALGFRNMAEFRASRAAMSLAGKVEQEAQVREQIRKKVENLRAPAEGATPAEHAAYRKSVLEATARAAREAHVPVTMELYEQAQKEVGTAAVMQVAALKERAAGEGDLALMVRRQADRLGALPTGQTGQAMRSFQERAVKAAELIHGSGLAMGKTVEEIREMLVGAAAASFESVTAQSRAASEQDIMMRFAADQFAKNMARRSESLADQLAMDQQVHAASEFYVKMMSLVGQQLDPAKAYQVFEAAAQQKARRVFDFRGSRFDIKQEFAEGFDPDRIAVAFANDLATLGERQAQSGYSPLFGVR